jgi:4-hydroxythreonine-4-phosphate dehydrogenase
MPFGGTIGPIAISAGDPAGIGPEIIAKAWLERHHQNLPTFFAVGDDACFLGHPAVPIARIAHPSEAAMHFESALPVIHAHNCGPIQPGVPDQQGAHCAVASLQYSVDRARDGSASALVTGPVSKAQLYEIGFTHAGQTEFVAQHSGMKAADGVMMLAGPDLRVVPITTHIPFVNVAVQLTTELICERASATWHALQHDFGIANPRLSVAGLNPHAGESGNIGREELDIFMPAINQLRAAGIVITEPLPADTLFHPEARATYDAVLCAYHDQALIPLKTIYFHEAVNITLGLPIVRTSPDHGTAFGIAGQNKANPGSMIAAIKLAAQVARNRLAVSR